VIQIQAGELTLLQFENLSRDPVVAHALTTRPHNYAPHRGPDRDRAVYWRKRVCEALGLPFEKLTSPEQVHGADVLAIADEDVGCGRDGREGAVRFVDGLITDRPGVPTIHQSADCPLVCVYDRDRPAVGCIHASWRGTVAGAATNLVRQMERSFESVASRLLAAVSPSAGPCCYEVGPHVGRIVQARFGDADPPLVYRNGRVYLDLWEANRRQLVDAGVNAASIELAGLCTICDERFWSHRRDGAGAGRTALFIGLR
jgi:YfiH family protein